MQKREIETIMNGVKYDILTTLDPSAIVLLTYGYRARSGVAFLFSMSWLSFGDADNGLGLGVEGPPLGLAP